MDGVGSIYMLYTDTLIGSTRGMVGLTRMSMTGGPAVKKVREYLGRGGYNNSLV